MIQDPPHRFVKVAGLSTTRAEHVKIECRCGHVVEAKTIVAAIGLFDVHHRNPGERP